MSTPQPPPVTAILEALKATKDEVAATKAEITALREDMGTDRQASQERDDRLARYGRNNRRYIAIDVLLTLVVTAFGALSVHTASQASQNHTAQIVTCQSSNQARAQNEQLWAYTLTLFKPRPGQTPQQQEQAAVALAALHAKVEQTFAPRNCSALARGEKP